MSDPHPRDEPGAWIRANEAWLREMANSDLDGAWVYERLLHSEGLDSSRPIGGTEKAPVTDGGPAVDSPSPGATYCPQCGEGLAAGDQFCRYCGTALDEV
jgi:hypothetical protein